VVDRVIELRSNHCTDALSSCARTTARTHYRAALEPLHGRIIELRSNHCTHASSSCARTTARTHYRAALEPLHGRIIELRSNHCTDALSSCARTTARSAQQTAVGGRLKTAVTTRGQRGLTVSTLNVIVLTRASARFDRLCGTDRTRPTVGNLPLLCSVDFKGPPSPLLAPQRFAPPRRRIPHTKTQQELEHP